MGTELNGTEEQVRN